MARLMKNDIYWVGKTDWELRKFHGDEYSVDRGSSYNSYLIKGKEKGGKNVLIDTVWAPYSDEFVRNLEQEINLQDIDYVIANHAEIDHSGGLPELLSKIPDVPVYCSKNGVKSLTGMYHQDWNFQTVKTGDKLNIGDRDLIFIEAPMLHWPDSMFTYLTGDNILFSNDAFGQHYASEFLFNDLVDQDELFHEAIKYYANILTPFSPLVTKKIKEVLGFNLPVDMIAPSHGVIWRNNPVQIVEQYLQWADSYQKDQITLIYDTMWNGTRRLAEAIAKGIRKADGKTEVKLFNTARTDKNDVITEIFKSKAVLIGSPTINKGILTSIAGILEEIKGLKFRGKKAASFGCYGWSGESPAILDSLLGDAGFEIVTEGLGAEWNPDEKALKKAEEFGESFVIACG